MESGPLLAAEVQFYIWIFIFYLNIYFFSEVEFYIPCIQQGDDSLRGKLFEEHVFFFYRDTMNFFYLNTMNRRTAGREIGGNQLLSPPPSP